MMELLRVNFDIIFGEKNLHKFTQFSTIFNFFKLKKFSVKSQQKNVFAINSAFYLHIIKRLKPLGRNIKSTFGVEFSDLHNLKAFDKSRDFVIFTSAVCFYFGFKSGHEKTFIANFFFGSPLKFNQLSRFQKSANCNEYFRLMTVNH